MPDLVMPKMGDGMEEGTIQRWLKKVGDHVAEEEIVIEINTEKAAIEVPSSYSGILTEILVKENETVPVGTVIGRLGGPEGASTGAASGAGSNGAASKPAEAAPATPAQETVDPSSTKEGPVGGELKTPILGLGEPAGEPTRVKASPLAKKVAAEHKLDLSKIEGTGPGGRIIEADVAEALQRQPAAAPTAEAAPAKAAPAAAPAPAFVPAANLPGEAKSLSPMRKVIASRLSQSKQTVPHFYLTVDVDMRAAAALREQYNGSVDKERKVSFNDLVLRASALALEKHPAVNSQWNGDSIQVPSVVNIGVAVSLEEGLIVPVVRDANIKSISAIGKEVRALAGKAREGKLVPADYSGGTFTVSNLGMYDIVQFQAIINPPEAAILAVGAIRDTPIVENGALAVGKQMYLTLSVDHRVVDGSVAAVFIQEVKKLLEGPMALFG